MVKPEARVAGTRANTVAAIVYTCTMWPFKKRFPPLSDMPDTAWMVYHGTLGGEPLVLRVNTWMRGWIGNPDFPYFVSVSVPFDPEAERWTRPSTDELAAFEDALTNRLCVDGLAVAVCVVTDPKAREFQFYASDAKSAEAAVRAVASSAASLSVQGVIRTDSKWRSFKSVLP